MDQNRGTHSVDGKSPSPRSIEFGLRRDADVAVQGWRHFGAKAFDEVEPRAVFRREPEGEAFLRLSGDPRPRFVGNTRWPRGSRRLYCIELLEETDELARDPEPVVRVAIIMLALKLT